MVVQCAGERLWREDHVDRVSLHVIGGEHQFVHSSVSFVGFFRIEEDIFSSSPDLHIVIGRFLIGEQGVDVFLVIGKETGHVSV